MDCLESLVPSHLVNGSTTVRHLLNHIWAQRSSGTGHGCGLGLHSVTNSTSNCVQKCKSADDALRLTKFSCNIWLPTTNPKIRHDQLILFICEVTSSDFGCLNDELGQISFLYPLNVQIDTTLKRFCFYNLLVLAPISKALCIVRP